MLFIQGFVEVDLLPYAINVFFLQYIFLIVQKSFVHFLGFSRAKIFVFAVKCLPLNLRVVLFWQKSRLIYLYDTHKFIGRYYAMYFRWKSD